MSDRGPLLWIAVVVAGIVAVLGVAALVGANDRSDETVPAGEWAQSVCGAVGVWRGDLEAIVEDIRTPTSQGTGSEEPQSETPQGRTGFVRQGLERAVQSTETMVELPVAITLPSAAMSRSVDPWSYVGPEIVDW